MLLVGADDAGQDDDAEHAGDGGGGQSADPALEEVGDGESAAAAHLGQRAGADQKAGEGEEHRDADEPAAEGAELEVEGHDEQHGDAAQAVERGDVAPRLNRLSRLSGCIRTGGSRDTRSDLRVRRFSGGARHKRMVRTWSGEGHRQWPDCGPAVRIYLV